jgi:hypothetical protein
MNRITAFKKLILSFILIAVVVNPLSPIIKPKIAQAIPVTDAPHTAVSVAGNVILGAIKVSVAATAVNTTLKTKFDLLKFLQKVAGQALKKLILDRLVDALVAYISGQSNTLVADWGLFFEQAGKDAVGVLAQDLGAGFLCRNFDINLRLMLLPLPKFSQRATCSLDDIVRNIDSFVENFTNGGFLAYQEQWYPHNNFYGSALSLLDEASTRSAKAQSLAESQLVAGGGFFSQVKCNPPGTNLNCKVVTPGSYIGDQVKDLIGPKREFWTILNADDVAAYVTAIVNAGINRLTKMGIDGLIGSLRGTSEFTTVTPQAPCAGLTGEAFVACVQYGTISNAAFQADQFSVQSLLASSLAPRQQAQTTLNQLIADQTELVDALDALAACRPQDTSVFAQLQEEQETLDNLLNQFDDNLTFLEPLEESSESINNLSGNDWIGLANPLLQSQALSDPETSSEFLSSVEEQRQVISENVNTKLPAIQEQLQQCSPAQPA